MRILFATQVDPAQRSGNARHVVALASALAAAGHEVTLLAPGRALIPGVHRLELPFTLGPGARLELALSARLLLAMRRLRFDVAYLRISPTTSALPLALGALGVPYVLELNGPVLAQLSAHGRPAVVVRLIQRVLGQVVRGARLLVVPSPRMLLAAKEELGAERLLLLENGADVGDAPPRNRRSARQYLGLPLEVPILTLVGTLMPALRLDLLFEAHRGLPGVALAIVGDGLQLPLLERAQKEASPSTPVIALGARPHREALEAIAAADVCVNVHDTDLALKSLEYAALGRRQVCFRVEGLHRLEGLYPGLEAVIVAEQADAGSLRRALARALEVDQARGPLPFEAIAKVRRQLSWGEKADRLVAALQGVIDR